VTQPFAIRLKVRGWNCDWPASELSYVHRMKQRIESGEVEPASDEPEWQRERSRRTHENEPQMRIADGGPAAGQTAEKSAEVVDANRDGADGSQCGGDARLRFDVFHLEWAESERGEEACGVNVVGQPPKAGFLGWQETVCKSAVWTRSGHDGKVTNLVAICELANGYRERSALELLECGLHGVERETQVTRQRVCAAQRDDSESGGRLAGFRRETLENLMDGAIASTGKHNVCSPAGGVLRMLGCRAGR